MPSESARKRERQKPGMVSTHPGTGSPRRREGTTAASGVSRGSTLSDPWTTDPGPPRLSGTPPPSVMANARCGTSGAPAAAMGAIVGHVPKEAFRDMGNVTPLFTLRDTPAAKVAPAPVPSISWCEQPFRSRPPMRPPPRSAASSAPWPGSCASAASSSARARSSWARARRSPAPSSTRSRRAPAFPRCAPTRNCGRRSAWSRPRRR